MKCPKCGNEFGDGFLCHHCGTDRVTAYGSYDGYSAPNRTVNPVQDKNEQTSISTSQDKFIVCWKCGEIIPKNAKYCPACGQPLFVTCPSCGKEYSSKYSICYQCGVDRNKYEETIKRLEDVKPSQIRIDEHLLVNLPRFSFRHISSLQAGTLADGFVPNYCILYKGELIQFEGKILIPNLGEVICKQGYIDIIYLFHADGSFAARIFKHQGDEEPSYESNEFYNSWGLRISANRFEKKYASLLSSFSELLDSIPSFEEDSPAIEYLQMRR